MKNELTKATGGTVGDEEPDASDHNPGRGRYRRELEAFTALTDTDKQSKLKETWKEVAMGTAARAKAFVATCGPKDFRNLQSLIMSGAIAIDKAYPPKQAEMAPKFIVNMFGSLGQRAAAIATPPVPIIDVTPKEVTCQTSVPNTTSK